MKLIITLSCIPFSNVSPLSKEKQNGQIYSLVICLEASSDSTQELWYLHNRSFNQQMREKMHRKKIKHHSQYKEDIV
jgi:hypothetical protein